MGRNQRRLERLLEELRGTRRLLILTHDNPDPDAIAAGWVLAFIVRRLLGLCATLAYEGVVGRAENRAMVDLLHIPLVRVSELDSSRFDAVALIDSQPGTGNNSLPRGVVPRVVFDHHGLRPATRHVPWADVRSDYGATATILTEYLTASGLPFTRRHATGLFYAIRSETQNLKREGAGPDLNAFVTLFPHVDSRLIGRIEQARISRSYLALLQGAFQATRLYGALSVTRLGALPYPDVVAELADLLLRLEEVRWAMVMGRYRGSIYVSLRTQAPRANAAREIRRLFNTLGKAGGHGMMAGGRIDVRANRLDAERIEREIERRARTLLGKGARGRRLLTGAWPDRRRTRGER
jgi:nanoRNase/pAp phosphatase (c-di-AMP/oligoRNAs hydrolase)